MGATIQVVVANGDRIHCDGVARNVAMRIGQEDISISCFSIDLGSFDLILDVNYLRTLGPVLWDFKDLSLSFWREARRVS